MTSSKMLQATGKLSPLESMVIGMETSSIMQHLFLLDHEGKLRHDFSRDYQHLKGSGICEFVNSIKAAIIHRKPGSSNTRLNGVTMQSNGSNQSTGRQPTLAAPWALPPSFPCPPPYPPPFPPPYPPAVHVPGWPPIGMHSSPHWIPPVPVCPPPGHSLLPVAIVPLMLVVMLIK